MNFGFLQDNSPRLPIIALLLLAGIYLLTGIGHDPWKTEDAIHIGIAHSFMTEGRWLFPRIAGEAWPHTAPLYHWVAALSGKLFGGLLEFHNAARLATTLFGALFLVSLAGAAHAFHGTHASRLAPLLAIGTVGLLLPFHEAQPAVAGLAFAALAWWGGALIATGRSWGGILLGAGIGLSFPAHGLVGLLMAVAVLPAPIFRRDWKSLAITLIIALPLLTAWPLKLAEQAPGLWTSWWQNEFAEATRARTLPSLHHLEQMTWAIWPVLPLAFWGAWIMRREGARLWFPLAGSLLGLGWYLSGSSRTLAMLPMLIPLTLLAAPGAERLRRGAANAFDWFGVMTFSFIAILIWLGASAQTLGWPTKIARNFEKLAPGHVAAYSLAALAFAAMVTLLWVLSARLPRAHWRAALRWAAGTLMMWALVTSLWLPWIEHYKSYRHVVQSLRAALPDDSGCIERNGIGPAQRALLDYYAAIRTLAPSAARNCNWRLSIGSKDRTVPAGWTEHWQGHRPSDRIERWYLDRRSD